MTDAWSRYWARETSGACLPGAPAAVQAALAAVWQGAFAELPAGSRLLDVASGGGALLKLLAESGSGVLGTGIDSAEVSPAAAALGVRGAVDAHALPFGDASQDVVISQFGLEYCGPKAWAEAARVLAPNGLLLLVCHHAESPAVRHNGRRLRAMQAMAAAGLFTLAEQIASGHGEDAALAQAVMAARRDHADQTVVSELPGALGHWAQRRQREAVAAIRIEAEAEMARLAAMQSAALDAEGVAQRLAWLAPLAAQARSLDGPDGVIGWVVRGQRD
ncbi:class I SAM-dependent methyltransferase [Sandarakinorhabdus sp. AAP62]|uniref:class I SAM-dependent methyltransferase n=1 Tax=Sandarakinorhabdus sp. AAP62 TaxID=1248916 RepID=UPI0002EDD2F7|nr:class I SAM-dependent methyltransferase [Sandarakinorhabdus sp. AAP62]